PFKKLHGYWLFESLSEDASKITLDLEFAFASPLIKIALGPVFETIATELVDRFRQRADAIYGARV
ncbi:MAG: ubiquinone-binding protein, partial [Gammaproteobacteria bacterium]|nr:ubiquinone-binding protein [Gammaproteobacteria bacterium]